MEKGSLKGCGYRFPAQTPRVRRIYHWRDRAELLMPPLPWDRPQWRDGGGPPVVLLHGLWRGWRAMHPLARSLAKEGYSTLLVPYPSSRMPIEGLVAHIRSQVETIARDQPVHFITHSLGGILVRALLAEKVPWEFGKVIMIAPPSHGSEIVDWAQNYPLFRGLLGPAGRALGSDGFPNKLPALPTDVQAAVIMGSRGSIPFFRRLLDSENDGIVSADKGRIEGLRGFSIVPADHTFIQMHPETIRLSLHFLKTGEWPA